MPTDSTRCNGSVNPIACRADFNACGEKYADNPSKIEKCRKVVVSKYTAMPIDEIKTKLEALLVAAEDGKQSGNHLLNELVKLEKELEKYSPEEDSWEIDEEEDENDDKPESAKEEPSQLDKKYGECSALADKVRDKAKEEMETEKNSWGLSLSWDYFSTFKNSLSTESLNDKPNFNKLGLGIDVPFLKYFVATPNFSIFIPHPYPETYANPRWRTDPSTGETKIVRDLKSEFMWTLGLGLSFMIDRSNVGALALRLDGSLGKEKYRENTFGTINGGLEYIVRERLGVTLGGAYLCNITEGDCYGAMMMGLKLKIPAAR